MSSPGGDERETLPPEQAARVDLACDRFEKAYRAGQRPRIEDQLSQVPDADYLPLLRELVALEIELRREQGGAITAAEYLARFTRLEPQWVAGIVAGPPSGVSAPPPSPPSAPPLAGQVRRIRCPHCYNPIQLVDDRPDEVLCPGCGSSFRLRDSRHTDTASGTRPLGKYHLLERVGIGAFGAVWKARDTELDRIVALKIPHSGLMTEADDLERFQREARSAAQLRHPGIVTVHDVQTLDGLPTIISDFITGAPLKDVLEVRHQTFREAAALLAEVAEAVHYAHGMGVVHRDLKPANIMIEAPPQSGDGARRADSDETRAGTIGRPLVMDFGLALRAEADVTLTLDGHIIGTPAYMSPEQAAGKGHQADARSDIYSLGVILYELLTGELPFRGSKAMLLMQVLSDDPRPPRKVNDKIPRDLETVCLKCLQKEPGRRYTSAGALAEDLRRWLKGEPIQARPVGAFERAARWSRRHPAATLLLVVGLLLVAGLPAGGVWVVTNYKVQGELKAAAAGEAAERAKAEAAATQAILAQRDAEQARAEAERQRQDANTARSAQEKQRYLAERLLSGIRVSQAIGQWRDRHPIRANELLDGCPPEMRFWDWRYVKRLCLTLPLQLDSDGSISSLCFSPDGRLLAGSDGSGVRVWDTGSGRILLTFAKYAGSVNSVCFSPDGRRLATASNDGTARVWEAQSGRELLVLKGHKRAVRSVSFSPEGTRLATAAGDNTVRLWDAGSGRMLLVVEGHTGSVNSVSFSPDGGQLATGSDDGTARLWDAGSGKENAILKRRGLPLKGVCFSPDGRRVAGTSSVGEVFVWDARNRQELFTFSTHRIFDTSAGFSPDGRLLAAGQVDGTVKVRDLASGSEVLELKGFSGGLTSVSFSSNGHRMATASPETGVRMWDVRDPRVDWGKYLFEPDKQDALLGKRPAHDAASVKVHRATVTCLAYSPDGERLAAGDESREVKVWDVRSGRELLVLGHAEIVYSLSFSPDGTRLATASKDRTARLFDASKGQELLVLKGHADTVNSVCFSPDGAQLVTASDDGTAKVWDANTGRELFVKHLGPVKGVCFSPDGRHVASASGPDRRLGLSSGVAEVVVWDVRNGQEMLTLKGHRGQYWCVCFSSDGQRLAAGGAITDGYNFSAVGGEVRVWDTRSGKELHTLRGHTHAVTSVCFSPDGQRLATSGGVGRHGLLRYSGEVKVWDTWSGQEVLDFKEFHGPVESVCFSPDGRSLAAGGDDVPGEGFGVRIWDAWTPQSMRLFSGHASEIEKVAFSADGKRLIATDSGGNSRLWDLAAGKELPAEQAPNGGGARTARSPDGRWFAFVDGRTVVVIKAWEVGDIIWSLGFASLDAKHHLVEAGRYERSGQWFAAAFHLSIYLKARPENARYLYGRLADALSRSPDRDGLHHLVALTYIAARGTTDYRRRCEDLLKRATPLAEIGTAIYALQPGPIQPFNSLAAAIPVVTPRPWDRAAIARACVLRPDAGVNPDLLLALTKEGDDSVTRGAVLYRVGRHDEALKVLSQSDEPAALLYRALAELGRGRLDAARAALDQAEKWLKTPDPDDPSQVNAAQLSWQRRLEVDLLRGEARKLLKAGKP